MSSTSATDVVEATLDFIENDVLLLRALIKTNGTPKVFGKKLAFFLDANVNTPINRAAVLFWSQMVIEDAVASRHTPPEKGTNAHFHYIVTSVDDKWAVSVRAARSRMNMCMEDFFSLCKISSTARRPAMATPNGSMTVSMQKSVKRESGGGIKLVTGYQLFGKQARTTIISEKAGITPQEVMAEIGKQWSSLPEADRSKWNVLASEQNAAAKAQM